MSNSGVGFPVPPSGRRRTLAEPVHRALGVASGPCGREAGRPPPSGRRWNPGLRRREVNGVGAGPGPCGTVFALSAQSCRGGPGSGPMETVTVCRGQPRIQCREQIGMGPLWSWTWEGKEKCKKRRESIPRETRETKPKENPGSKVTAKAGEAGRQDAAQKRKKRQPAPTEPGPRSGRPGSRPAIPSRGEAAGTAPAVPLTRGGGEDTDFQRLGNCSRSPS